jgi:threonine dehydrogenase-like Zn-dependent dehydrogenase
MRAVMMQSGNLWVDDIALPEPQDGEVLVRTCACGICGTDLHAVKHTAALIETSRAVGGGFKLTTENPVVLGHEFCAEVVDFGPGTRRQLPVGQLVCSVPVLLRAETVGLGYSDQAPGGFAEYMVLSEAMLNPVPSGVSADQAALTEPLAVGRHAVAKAGLQGSEEILVVGCGPVGLAVIASLKALGHGPVYASDFSSARRALAEQLGADEVVDPELHDPLRARSWPKDGQTVIFDCVGVVGMIDQIFTAAPQNARLVIVGVCLETDHARPLIAVNKELNVQYVLGYSAEEFSQTLSWIADGRFDVSEWVTQTVGLDGVVDAFAKLAAPDAHGKILVDPGV